MTDTAAAQSIAANAPLIVPREGELHHIVIVGGGAGGLELATQLGRKSRPKP